MRVTIDNFHKDIRKKNLSISFYKKPLTNINNNTSRPFLIILSSIVFLLGIYVGMNSVGPKEEAYSATQSSTEQLIYKEAEDNGLIKEEYLPNITATTHPHIETNNDELGVLVENYYLKLPADIQAIADNEDWKIIIEDNMASYSKVSSENGKTTIYLQDSPLAAEKLYHEVGFLLWNKDDNQNEFIEIANDELLSFTTTFKTSKSDLVSANTFYGESFYRYIQNPSVLSVKCPRIYNYWNSKYGKENEEK